MDLSAFSSHAGALIVAVALDVIVGDPVYRWHPVRLIGWTLVRLERALRAIGANGHGGGVLLLVLLGVLWAGGLSLLVVTAAAVHRYVPIVLHVFTLYSLLALGDLLKHTGAVDRAASTGDLQRARREVAKLAGRDTDRMDLGACRRAAIESLAENLTDGFISPLFWYVAAGLPGIVLFKVVSTMDSMVGYRDARYLRFGWCGARADDAMNLVPARLTWAWIAMAAVIVPRCSPAQGLLVGWRQHAVVPGPNSGWSEAAMAGAIQRRLVGPIWMHGALVTETWLGRDSDPPAGSADDYGKAARIVRVTSAIAVLIAFWTVWYSMRSAR